MIDDLLAMLRGATEEDVLAALEGAHVSLPIASPVEAVEFFNVMLDYLTDERALAQVDDQARINAAVRARRE